MQLFSVDAMIFKFFSQTAQTEEFMLRNVAYRPIIYRIGLLALTAKEPRVYLALT